jgi:hypothetical protein
MKNLTPFVDNQDRTFNELSKFLNEQQRKLLALIDAGLDEFSPEAVFGDIDEDENKL